MDIRSLLDIHFGTLLAKLFLSQWENFDFSWRPYLVFMTKVELFIPCWLEAENIARSNKVTLNSLGAVGNIPKQALTQDSDLS